ncbi:helicase HerA-like domain-containing protein [Nitrosomonas sp. ANs5]|uniref:helicase HerA-like domain-containing protein n=1 Tax=Nitrosomonas sp. ANs5 TaxID=3423941 RepID=UPI003D340DD9
MNTSLAIAQSSRSSNQVLSLNLRLANRHGLIAGATGTGKTVTLQVLAEQFSRAGVPVFMADVKGDLSGLAMPGGGNQKIDARIRALGLNGFTYQDNPVIFWDVFGEQGHPVRATVSDMGPLLLARMLHLNPVQTGILTIVFKIADDHGLLLLDLKDLRAMLTYVSENARILSSEYGHIARASVGAIQRSLLQLTQEGGDHLFGEPMLDITDLMQTNGDGHGTINILAAETLYRTPRVYATLLLWLLSELFEQLPEIGDSERPRLVFFFDEAHLLFKNAPKALLDKIEQVVRLIRSKGVGIYFISQNPLDIPDAVLGQLGNRVQHALRAFTPKDQKAVRAAAQTFRTHPGIDVETAITQLGIGEALVSFLDDEGRPHPVEMANVHPPHSLIGMLPASARQSIIRNSPIYGLYETSIDRESAYEILQARTEQSSGTNPARQANLPTQSQANTSRQSGRTSPGLIETFARQTARTVGNEIGRRIIRGVLGSILGNGRR